MRQAINFLLNIFSESMEDTANIIVAEAEGDKETISKYLMCVRDFIDDRLKELK